MTMDWLHIVLFVAAMLEGVAAFAIGMVAWRQLVQIRELRRNLGKATSDIIGLVFNPDVQVIGEDEV